MSGPSSNPTPRPAPGAEFSNPTVYLQRAEAAGVITQGKFFLQGQTAVWQGFIPGEPDRAAQLELDGLPDPDQIGTRYRPSDGMPFLMVLSKCFRNVGCYATQVGEPRLDLEPNSSHE